MKKLFSILSVCLVTMSFSYAQTSSAKGKLSDLGFTEGSWKATVGERTIEATWLPEKENNIVGFFRMMNGGKPTMFELLVYEQTENGPVSLVKHFLSGLIGQEPIDKPISHRWIESGPGRVVFEKDGDPVRVLYEKKSTDQFVISLGKQDNGKWVFAPLFDFKRAK